jgi:hypothetical protein
VEGAEGGTVVELGREIFGRKGKEGDRKGEGEDGEGRSEGEEKLRGLMGKKG